MLLPVSYPNRKLRIVIAILASFYILFHGRSLDIIGSLQMPAFYGVFTVSFTVALLLVSIVHYVTIWFDEIYDWLNFPFRRFVAQLVCGVLLPLLVDFVILSIYFYFVGSNIFENGFIRHDFPVIVCFIVILNMFYTAFYMYQLMKTKERFRENPASYSVVDLSDHRRKDNRGTNDFDILSIDNNGLMVNFKVSDDIVYFYREDRKMFAVTIDGKIYSFKMTIDELREKYDAVGLCQISRTVVVNCMMVSGYTTSEKRGIYIAIIKPQFNQNLPVGSERHFIITKEYIDLLKVEIENN